MYLAWTALVIDNVLSILFIDALGTSLRVLLAKKKACGEYSVRHMRAEYDQIHILNTLFRSAFTNPYGIPSMKLTLTITALALISVGIRLAAKLNPFVIRFFYLGSF